MNSDQCVKADILELMQKILFVYVPGLGSDESLNIQRSIINRWQSKNKKVLFVNPKWQNGSEDLNSKIQRLLNKIKVEMNSGVEKVCLVGSSAGGSMAINLYDKLKGNADTYCVLISSKLLNPQRIGNEYRKLNPFFVESVEKCEKLILVMNNSDKSKILSMIPLYDGVIPLGDMKISGASSKRLFVLGHTISIGYAILFKKRVIFHWPKSGKG